MAVRVDTNATVVARPGLVERIEDALDRGSVLVVAAAGYGKSTALHEALAARGEPSTWISCAHTGGDGGRLLVALVERLRRVAPGSADVLAERIASASQRLDAARL